VLVVAILGKWILRREKHRKKERKDLLEKEIDENF
jgi:hypothetical protein